MRDLHTADADLLTRMTTQLAAVAVRYGYHAVETPVLERRELFTAKSGPDIVEQLYSLQDKSGRDLALKPDITPALTRYFLQHCKADPRPVRLSTSDRVYRYEAPQAGRLREIRQFNAEQFGGFGAACDSEVIQHFVASLEAVGLTTAKIMLGDRIMLAESVSKLTGCGAQEIPFIVRILDKADKVPPGALAHEIRMRYSPAQIDDLDPLIEFAYLQDPIDQVLEQLARLLPDSRVLTMWQDLSAHLHEADGVYEACTLRPGLARGFDYYNGVLMEAVVPGIGRTGAVGGGGRYDDLTVAYGGPAMPCIGFSLGLDRIMSLLQQLPDRYPIEMPEHVTIGATEPDLLMLADKIAAHLRRADTRTRVIELAYQARSRRRLFEAARKRGSTWLITVTPNDTEVLDLGRPAEPIRYETTDIPAMLSDLPAMLAGKAILGTSRRS